MTAMRPDEGGSGWGADEDPHAAAPGAYEAAIDALRDPLTDPLPDGYGTVGPGDGRHDPYPRPEAQGYGTPGYDTHGYDAQGYDAQGYLSGPPAAGRGYDGGSPHGDGSAYDGGPGSGPTAGPPAGSADPYAGRGWFEAERPPAGDAAGLPERGGRQGYDAHQGYPAREAAGTAYGDAGAGYDAAGTGYADPGTGYGDAGTGYADPGTGYDGAKAAYGDAGTGAYDGTATAYEGYENYDGLADGPAGGQPPAAHDPETIGLRRPEDLHEAARTASHARPADPAGSGREQETVGLRRPGDLRGPGRRRAAAGEDPDDAAGSAADGAGGGDRADGGAGAKPAAGTGSRVARRQAEKARRTTRANKIANVIGELMITTGALLMLFVTYQLWWTNVEARAHANSQARQLVQGWEEGGEAPSDPADPEPGEEGPGEEPGPPPVTEFSPGEGFALLHLPTIGKRVPIAEGVDEKSVLDRGMVGRYSEEDGLPTAMPWDETGNVGLAGHRNTHGEPFRYINKLSDGDPIVIETEHTYYVYEVRSRLDSTSPSNIQVLDPIPTQGGFTEPGRYVTLTTCTPEYTSTYRLIVWGEMVEEHPRGEGEPDALAD